jgi:hypothetical protein
LPCGSFYLYTPTKFRSMSAIIPCQVLCNIESIRDLWDKIKKRLHLSGLPTRTKPLADATCGRAQRLFPYKPNRAHRPQARLVSEMPTYQDLRVNCDMSMDEIHSAKLLPANPLRPDAEHLTHAQKCEDFGITTVTGSNGARRRWLITARSHTSHLNTRLI